MNRDEEQTKKSILLEINHSTGFIVLNRPEAGNAIHLQMAKELLETVIYCSENDKIRTVVLTGKGNKFSVGGDLKSFVQEKEQIGEHLKLVTAYLHQAISHLTKMNKPVIGAVNGVAAGAGVSMACACDLVYACEEAHFIMAYNSIGFTPDGSGSYFLPRMVGIRRAIELLYTNKKLSALEAREWGIVNEIFPETSFLAQVTEIAESLAKGPIETFGLTKKLLYHSLQETLESQMAIESNLLADRAKSKEGQEGISAFIEKRLPNYLRS